MNFKTISFQPTGNLSVDTFAFQGICAKKNISLETTGFLENKVRSKLGNNFALYLSKNKAGATHYIFITATSWDKDMEDKFIKFLSEIMCGSGHDGIRAFLHVYSYSDLSEKVIKYLEWANK